MVQTLQIDLPKSVQKTLDSQKTGLNSERATIIHATLASNLKPEDKTLETLLDRVFVVLGAGAETTSWTLAVIIYHLLSQPAILERLARELKEVVDDPQQLPSWTTLQKLPYLDGVIQEGLRLSCTCLSFVTPIIRTCKC